jgi:hypothetical protein
MHDCIIDYIAVFPTGNNELFRKQIRSCNLMDLAQLTYELVYTNFGMDLKAMNQQQFNELIQIILDETNLRCVKKEPLVVVDKNKENNKNIKELSIYAEEFNPYKEGINFDYKILEKIYYTFNNETDINGYSSIDLFCYNNNITTNKFIDLVKNNTDILMTMDRFKSINSLTIKHINSIKDWTYNSIYMIFNNRENYYHKFVENNFILFNHILKDQNIKKYFNNDTLKHLLQKDCRFRFYKGYLTTTI